MRRIEKSGKTLKKKRRLETKTKAIFRSFTNDHDVNNYLCTVKNNFLVLSLVALTLVKDTKQGEKSSCFYLYFSLILFFFLRIINYCWLAFIHKNSETNSLSYISLLLSKIGVAYY